jgi:hypothetical protein
VLFIFIAQLGKPPQFVVLVAEGLACRIKAAADSAHAVVFKLGFALQGIGMAKQAAFGIVLQHILRAIRVDDFSQLAIAAILVLAGITCGILCDDQAATGIVLPLAGFARAIAIALQ